MRLSIVEAVPGAVSVYGRSVAGVHLAGLIKARSKSVKTGGNSVVVSVELKGGNKGLLDTLIDVVNDLD